MRPGNDASPAETGPAMRIGADRSGVSVAEEWGVVKERLAEARPVAFAEVLCSCGSEAIVGRCMWCSALLCGSCAVGVGPGLLCEPCRFGQAVGP